MIDAVVWSVAWAIVAAVTSAGLVVAARALVRRAVAGDYDFAAGYNALATVTDR
jgi:hypothetical protein